MGRREQTCLEAKFLESGGCFDRNRAFSVGSSDVDNFEIALMRIAELLGKLFHLIQVQLFPLLDILLPKDGPREDRIEALHVPLLQIGHGFNLELRTEFGVLRILKVALDLALFGGEVIDLTDDLVCLRVHL